MLVGLLVGWLIARARGRAPPGRGGGAGQRVDTRLEERAERVAQSGERARRGPSRERGLREQRGRLRAAQARLATQVDGRARSGDREAGAAAGRRAATARSFQSLSAEALRQQQPVVSRPGAHVTRRIPQGGQLRTRARRRSAIDELVKPIRDSLQQVDAKLRGGREGARRQLPGAERTGEIAGRDAAALAAETANLVKALRAPDVRGRWGEMQLRRVVEMAGMLPTATSSSSRARDTEDGRLRPDLVVRLPGGKNVVVDAKAPLAAYLEALEATDDAARAARLARPRAPGARPHRASSARKAYWEQFQPRPSSWCCSCPGETFFAPRCEQDPR